jgi:phage terminase large subunit-like protein
MPRRKTRGELAADRAVAFMTQLRQSTGKWAGVPLKLQGWQENEVIRPLFGTLDRRGKRRYRSAYIEVPRKNGKSTLAAAVALYLLFADREPGAQIYGAAADRDQASIVFNEAAQMVRQHPTLAGMAKIIDSQKRIVVPSTGSFYRAIPADAAGSHGFNASAIIFDELHAQGDRQLWDVMTTSTSSREQPLLFGITTAGDDRTSICWELHEYAERLLRGEVKNPAFFAYLRGWSRTRTGPMISPGCWRVRAGWMRPSRRGGTRSPPAIPTPTAGSPGCWSGRAGWMRPRRRGGTRSPPATSAPAAGTSRCCGGRVGSRRRSR